MHEVQSIAKHGLDWASYDEMYRRDRLATRITDRCGLQRWPQRPVSLAPIL